MWIEAGLLFALAAAGAPSATPSRGAARQPVVATACSTATREEVRRALGVEIAQGMEERKGAESSCTFQGEGGQVVLTVLRSDRPLGLAEGLDALRSALPAAKVAVAPLGKGSALMVDLGAEGVQWHVVQRERQYLMVSVLGFGDAAEMAPRAAQIALIALGRL